MIANSAQSGWRGRLARRAAWKPTTTIIVALAVIIGVNEAQRIEAQWQGHRERMAQIYQARADGMQLDWVILQNDLQIQLLMQHSTDFERLKYAQKEKDILLRPGR